jgi:hypothetical protein
MMRERLAAPSLTTMPETTFIVERYIPHLEPSDVHALADRLAAATAQMQAEGHNIRWLHSFALLDDETCLCVFSADDSAEVYEANHRASADHERIVPVIAVDNEPRGPMSDRCRPA